MSWALILMKDNFRRLQKPSPMLILRFIVYESYQFAICHTLKCKQLILMFYTVAALALDLKHHQPQQTDISFLSHGLTKIIPLKDGSEISIYVN